MGGSRFSTSAIARLATKLVMAAIERPKTSFLERIPNRLNRERALDSLFGRIFCGKPVPTFPENALPVDLGVVLRVRNVLEPGDMVAVEMLLQRNMHHVGVGTGAVPVLFSGRDPDRVAGMDFAYRAAPQLHPSYARDHVQGLAERVGVPRGACLGLESDPGAPDARRRRG